MAEARTAKLVRRAAVDVDDAGAIVAEALAR
jgi:hypothetical protein